MLKSLIISFIVLVGCANSILSQQVRPLPRPIINIQCNRASILRTTGLIPPPINQPIPQTCTYTIHALSLFICQIRLDFTKFTLPNPRPTTLNGNGNVFQRCVDGYLQVGNITLCGENAGQHIYIPINPRNIAERQLKIQIVTNGNGLNGNIRPDWNIAVHQFECPLGQSRKKDDEVSVAKTDAADNHRTARTFISDWLAPPGCLQYHPMPTGSIESFNFNDGKGSYIGDMNYAICFRRTRGATILSLTRTFFSLGITNPDPNLDGINDECFEPEHLATTGRSEDFLFVPNAIVDFPAQNSTISNNPGFPPSNGNGPRRLRATRFCGTGLNRATSAILSSPPGPFMVGFNSDDQYYSDIEIGFRINYEIL